MTVTSHDVPGRPAPSPGFAAVTVAQDGRLIHVSGQVGPDDDGAAVTLIGVAALFTPDMLIEIEAVAVAD